MALRRGGDALELANLDQGKYGDLSFSVDPDQVNLKLQINLELKIRVN